MNGRENINEGIVKKEKPRDWPKLELMKVTIRVFHTRSAQEISAKRACPPVLPFPFWACRLPLGSSYITFLHCFVPHLSFPFPPAPAFSFDKLLHFLRLVLKSPDARLWKGQLFLPSRSVTLTFRVQISHLTAQPNVCIPPPLSQTCGKYTCTPSAYTALKMDTHILNRP